MIIKTLNLTLFLYFFLAVTFVSAGESQQIILGNFSQQSHNLPKSWKSLVFGSIEEHTSYTLVNDQNIKVIKAESTESASGLTKTIRFNPKEYPYISWRWKVNKAISGTDAT